MTIEEQVLNTILEETGKVVTPDYPVTELDSLEFVNVWLKLQEIYSITVPDDQIIGVKTVADVCRVIAGYIHTGIENYISG
jgi:acyl carrier protein